MIRAEKGDQRYWDEWIDYRRKRLDDMWEKSKVPAGDPTYAPQYMFELAKNHWHLMFCLYSRGDSIKDLMQLFEPMLDAWEDSISLGQNVWSAEQQHRRQAWALNFDHYIICFWLVGLALTLELSDQLWDRLVVLIGNEGEDILLDRIIASRATNRRIGTELCYKRPYERLMSAIDAPGPQQGKMLLEFVENWYDELALVGKTSRVGGQALPSYPYWHKLGDKHFEDGAYFGRWCVEAVAAVKAFGIDDSLCVGHQNYPGDLLRSIQTDGQKLEVKSSVEQKRAGWFRGLFGR